MSDWMDEVRAGARAEVVHYREHCGDYATPGCVRHQSARLMRTPHCAPWRQRR